MNVALLLENYVEEIEFLYPLYRFKEEGIDVTVISTKQGEFKGKNGMILKSDKMIDINDYKNFDAVFVPGGYAPDYLRRSKEILDFIKKMFDSGKIVAAICHGPWLLISAGIVKNKKITSFYSIKDDLINAGAIYTGKSVERDGNIITGTDPSALPDMMKEIIRALKPLP